MVQGWLCRQQRIPGALAEVISVMKGAEISGKRPGFKSDFLMQFLVSAIEYSGHLDQLVPISSIKEQYWFVQVAEMAFCYHVRKLLFNSKVLRIVSWHLRCQA